MDVAFLIMFCNKPEQTIEALKSVGQTKVYLLNNGSSPEATKIVEKYLKTVDNVEYYKSKTNLGVSKGRNFLIKNSTEQWLFFIDNDIVVETPDWQRVLQAEIRKKPGILAFIPKLFNAHMNSWEKFYSFSVQNNRVTTYVTRSGISNKIAGGASIINRKIFDTNGLYDEEMFVGFEDFEFALRAIKKHKDLVVRELLDIKLRHNHIAAKTQYDKDYLKVRYDSQRIKQSYERIKKLYGWELADDGSQWAQKKLQQMVGAQPNLDVKSDGLSKLKSPSIIIFHGELAKIGGIETSIVLFCKRMAPYYNITVLCNSGDPKKLAEIGQYSDVAFNKGQKYQADICIYSTAWGSIPDEKVIKAKTYIQMLHGDYEWMKKVYNFTYKKIVPNIQHVAVGEHVRKQFEKVTGNKATVIHNFLEPEVKIESVLRLITVSRMDRFKGFHRVEKMARRLKAEGRKFIWLIYGDSGIPGFTAQTRDKFKDIPEVIFMGVNTADVMDYVANSDYLVALSDAEGFSYSIYESLQVGTPCIVTDFPSAHEQIEDGKNGYIVDMDLKNLDLDKIYNHIPKGFKFEEFSSEKDWIDFLGGTGKKIPGKAKKIVEDQIPVRVQVVRGYKDAYFDKHVNPGEVLVMPRGRALQVLANPMNLVKLLD